jgi:hypothetical protein
VTLTLALAACGGGTSSKTLMQAAEKSTEAPGAATSYSGTIQVPGQKQKAKFGGRGVLDNTSHRTRVSVDLSDFARLLGGKGKLDQFKGEEIVDSARQIVLYLRFKSLASNPRKPWVKVELSKSLQTQGFNAASLTQIQNPSQYLEYLLGATGKTKKLGKETIGGVQTTHYSGTIDLLHYPDGLSPERETPAREIVNRIVQSTGRRLYPTEVWIDHDGFVRQMTFAYVIPAPNSDAKIRYDLTLKYSDFGKRQQIPLPPPSQVGTGSSTP